MAENNVWKEMGIDLKDASSTKKCSMKTWFHNLSSKSDNNSAENTLIKIANIIGGLGILCTPILFCALCFVKEDRLLDRWIFNPAGLGITCSVLFLSILYWAILRVLANISLTLKEIKKKLSK
ncbi:MAG: hypothetical protein IJ786_00830 [Bacteroidaceae bacterium]|nr:hypothetical protein [Bacteroidaceae bacterium]